MVEQRRIPDDIASLLESYAIRLRFEPDLKRSKEFSDFALKNQTYCLSPTFSEHLEEIIKRVNGGSRSP
jgi:hypothetical protein